VDYLKRVFNQISDFVGGMSPVRKLALAGTGVAILIGVGVLFGWAGEQAYRPLMTNLNPEDSTSIIRILRQKKIPFKVDEAGRNVSVPPEAIYDLRLELSTMGLPESSTVGYELFDQQQLGQTSFVQRINRQRALEGELMRTIATIKGVRRARVHLAIPKKATFIEDQKSPTGSVALELEPATRLSDKQVIGIGVMVAGAVEGLEPEEVTIVDQNGKILSHNNRDPYIAATATQLDFQRRMEEGIERRIEGMLGRVVGDGRVVARVNAELDFSRVSEEQTLYDPDSTAALAEQQQQENMEMVRPGPIGRPGVATNTPGQQPGVNEDNNTRSNTNKNRKVTNFAVPKTVRKTVRPYGSVKKLSVAVVIDGKQVTEAGDDGLVTKSEPWSDEKLAEFTSLISRTVGIDSKRGDTIEVKNMEFTREDFGAAQALLREAERRQYVRNVIVYGLIGLIIAFFFLFVVRPYIKWITENTVDSVDSFLPQTIEELEGMQGGAGMPGLEDAAPVIPERIDPDKVEGEMIKEKIITLVDTNPQKAAMVVRDWLKGEVGAASGGSSGGQTA
jgi:flagellar M-ring protein FliF